MQQVVLCFFIVPLTSVLTAFSIYSAAASSESVADFAIFMIIATFRNLNWCTTASLDPTTFKDCHANSAAISRNPRGHTLGIIGLGNIGFTIALKAYHAFHMKIIYYDVVRKSPNMEQEIDARFVGSLDELLEQSDCIVLATPASPDGKKVITKERVEKMKMGSRYVKTFFSHQRCLQVLPRYTMFLEFSTRQTGLGNPLSNPSPYIPLPTPLKTPTPPLKSPPFPNQKTPKLITPQKIHKHSPWLPSIHLRPRLRPHHRPAHRPRPRRPRKRAHHRPTS